MGILKKSRFGRAGGAILKEAGSFLRIKDKL
jgi:hypothetical protein